MLLMVLSFLTKAALLAAMHLTVYLTKIHLKFWRLTGFLSLHILMSGI